MNPNVICASLAMCDTHVAASIDSGQITILKLIAKVCGTQTLIYDYKQILSTANLLISILHGNTVIVGQDH